MKKLSFVLALTLVFALLALTACSPVDSVKNALEKDGWTVEVAEKDDLDDYDYEASASLMATKEGKLVTVVWFVKEEDAKSYESAMKAGGLGDLVGGFVGSEIYRDGKMVAVGSKEGIEIIK